MLLYCLKYRGNTESKNPKVVRIKHGQRMLYENVQCVTVKNQNFLKNKKLKEY